tara:strand:- start:1168 stop:3108 length:1941 start_codon:yes stop_codon:yes gene_type:complete
MRPDCSLAASETAQDSAFANLPAEVVAAVLKILANAAPSSLFKVKQVCKHLNEILSPGGSYSALVMVAFANLRYPTTKSPLQQQDASYAFMKEQALVHRTKLLSRAQDRFLVFHCGGFHCLKYRKIHNRYLCKPQLSGHVNAVCNVLGDEASRSGRVELLGVVSTAEDFVVASEKSECALYSCFTASSRTREPQQTEVCCVRLEKSRLTQHNQVAAKHVFRRSMPLPTRQLVLHPQASHACVVTEAARATTPYAEPMAPRVHVYDLKRPGMEGLVITPPVDQEIEMCAIHACFVATGPGIDTPQQNHTQLVVVYCSIDSEAVWNERFADTHMGWNEHDEDDWQPLGMSDIKAARSCVIRYSLSTSQPTAASAATLVLCSSEELHTMGGIVVAACSPSNGGSVLLLRYHLQPGPKVSADALMPGAGNLVEEYCTDGTTARMNRLHGPRRRLRNHTVAVAISQDGQSAATITGTFIMGGNLEADPTNFGVMVWAKSQRESCTWHHVHSIHPSLSASSSLSTAAVMLETMKWDMEAIMKCHVSFTACGAGLLLQERAHTELNPAETNFQPSGVQHMGVHGYNIYLAEAMKVALPTDPSEHQSSLNSLRRVTYGTHATWVMAARGLVALWHRSDTASAFERTMNLYGAQR